MKKFIPFYFAVLITLIAIWWTLGIGWYRIESDWRDSEDIGNNTGNSTITIWHNGGIVYREFYSYPLSQKDSTKQAHLKIAQDIVAKQGK